MAEFSGSGLAISSSLLQHDPELFDLIEREKYRQWSGLELIASENFTNGAVLECLGSCLTNKYAEGLPSARYYGGNENIDKIEELCRRRALEVFNLNPEEWGVNVQPYSGSPANFAVYTALLRPHDRIMGLDLPSGGHLTHGYYTFAKGARKPISATSIFFESLPYQVNPQTGLLDLAALRQQAMLFRPSLIITGGSAYPREWPYAEIKSIADDCGALLMCDMAHIAGLIAGSEAESPFEVCDVVTTTTHKTLGGPRAGIIFFKKYKMVNGTKVIVDFESRINSAVFPGLQGGPHENTIAAIATQLKLVSSVEFRRYAGQVRRNISRLSLVLMSFGYKLATDGTDNHLLLWDLRPLSGDGSIHGAKFEKYLDRVHITVNKNTICGQTNAVNPAAIRIGSPALTTRGMGEEDFALIGQLLHRSVQNLIQLHGHAKCCNKSKDVGKDVNTVTTKAFVEFLDIRREELDELNHSNEVKIAFSVMDEIRHQVAEFAMRFPMPGFDVSQMRYRSEEDVANAIHVTNA